MIDLIATPILLAQSKKYVGGHFEGIGELGAVKYFVGVFSPGMYPRGAFELFFRVLSAIIGIMTISAAIWFVFQFFIGAIQIMTSSGDKTKMQEASGRITHAVIGIVVVIGAIFFISLIGALTGLNILGPWEFITELWSNP